MQREIKFKGKTNSNEWVYGYMVKYKSRIAIIPALKDGFISVCTDFESAFDFIGEKFIEVKSETISQFTGLQDKNNKDIYENDILKGFVSGNCVVFYKTVNGRWEAKNKTHGFKAHKFNICEIIGNKFDNSELLEK